MYLNILLVILFVLPASCQVWQYRLSGTGASNRKGRLEIKIGTSAWGTVCKDGFNNNDAVVACRSLGIDGGATFIANARPVYGNPGNIPILRTAFQCQGNEQNLARCISAGDTSGCTHDEDIGLECLGVITVPTTTVPPDFNTLPPVNCDNNNQRVRLVGGDSTQGRVEIFYNNTWGTICDDLWDQKDAKVICTMLCNSNANAQAIIRSQFPQGADTMRIWLSDVQCTGTESQIDQCTHTGWGNTTKCTHKKDAGVICAPPGSIPGDPFQPTISCTNNSIVAEVEKARYPSITMDQLSLVNPGTAGCNVRKTQDANYITITIPFVGCNTEKVFSPDHITYKNTLRRSIPATNIITRDSIIDVEVSCQVRRQNTDQTEMDPVMIRGDPVSSNSEFNVQMFVIDPATNEKKALPARIPLGGIGGVAMELVAQDPTLKLVLPDCFASPDLTVTATSKKYQLIQDKCRSDDTVTIRVIDQKTIGFTFKIFMFMNGATPEENLYLHCTAIICGVNEGGEKCDQTCSARKKRDIRHRRGLKPTLAVVEGVEGPFHVIIPEGVKTEVHEGTLWKTESVGSPDTKPQNEQREGEGAASQSNALLASIATVLLSMLFALAYQ